MKSRQKASCPFCWEWLPLPRPYRKVFSGDGCIGGRCECGAWFVFDVTGHEGGQAVLDVRALACDGDLDRALSLRDGLDAELKTQPLLALAAPSRQCVRRGVDPDPKVWALRLKEGPKEGGASA